MKRKALAMVLALCMVLSMLPMNVFAVQPQKAPQSGMISPSAVETLPTAAVTPNARSYSVSLTSSGKGETELLVSSPAQAGSEVYFMANPDDGYLAEVYVDGIDPDEVFYLGADIWGFYMPSNKVTIEVCYVAATGSSHKLKLYEGKGGQAVLDRTSAKADESVYLAVLPDDQDLFDPYQHVFTTSGDLYYLYMDTETGAHYYELFMPDENVNVFVEYKKSGPYRVVDFLTSGDHTATVKIEPTSAYFLDTVTVTITPAPGYELTRVKAVSWAGDLVSDLTPIGNNQYTFTMHPADVDLYIDMECHIHPITVTVETGLGGTASVNVSEAIPGETVTLTCAPQEGYRVAQITGVSNLTDNGDNTYTFTMPDKAVELKVLFLRNENPFLDVNETQFFYDSVLWAVENSITTGISADAFDPFAECNRAQVVTFLWRYAGSPEPTVTSHPFEDVAANSFYEKAVLWALENGITNGISATEFGANLPCNRAQVVTFLWRMMKQPTPSLTEHPFTDVAAKSFYEQPVLWALENGITTGASATAFNPDGKCQRAQVVTFLYRTAQLAPAVHAVSAQFDPAMGTVTLSHEEAAAGEVITATVVPAEGYLLDWIQCESGAEITVVSETEFTFVMPDQEEVFYAGFAPIETEPTEPVETYELVLKDNGHGTVTHVDATSAAPGESIFFYAVPEEGYFLERVGIFNPDNAIDVSQIRLYEHEDNLYELVMINHDIIMTLYFSPIPG